MLEADTKTTEGKPQEPVPATKLNGESLSQEERRLQRTKSVLTDCNDPEASPDVVASERADMDVDPRQVAKGQQDQPALSQGNAPVEVDTQQWHVIGPKKSRAVTKPLMSVEERRRKNSQ